MKTSVKLTRNAVDKSGYIQQINNTIVVEVRLQQVATVVEQVNKRGDVEQCSRAIKVDITWNKRLVIDEHVVVGACCDEQILVTVAVDVDPAAIVATRNVPRQCYVVVRI